MLSEAGASLKEVFIFSQTSVAFIVTPINPVNPFMLYNSYPNIYDKLSSQIEHDIPFINNFNGRIEAKRLNVSRGTWFRKRYDSILGHFTGVCSLSPVRILVGHLSCFMRHIFCLEQL